MFGDDSFDQLVREFFGSGASGVRNSNVSERRVSQDSSMYASRFDADFDRVETGKDYFVVVHVHDPVNEKDLVLEVEEDFDTESQSWLGSNDRALSIMNRAKKDSFLKIKIPKKIAKKKFSYTFHNGILEVRFK